MEKLQTLRGMRDLLPGETQRWRYVEQTLVTLLQGAGFDEIRLPIAERTELFARSAGETSDIVEKQMYTFADNEGLRMTLRPEGTAGCVRACIENGLLRSPQRLWYAGNMFRYERPQKGRYREFTQIGAESFGYATPDVEAELIELVTCAWRHLGVDAAVQLELNSIGDRDDRLRYRQILVEYLERFRADLDEDSQRRLERNPLRILDSKVERTQQIVAGAPRLRDHLGDGARAHFAQLCELLEGLSIPYRLNDQLVRGLDYYNRTVFEWTTSRLGAQGTLCAGGRYDGLVESLGGPDTPAAGFAVGIDRVVLLHEELTQDWLVASPHAYFIIGDERYQGLALQQARRFREAVPGLRLRVNQGGGKFKTQFKRADQSGALVALVVAEDEAAANQVTLKWLREERTQERCDEAGLIQHLRSLVIK